MHLNVGQPQQPQQQQQNVDFTDLNKIKPVANGEKKVNSHVQDEPQEKKKKDKKKKGKNLDDLKSEMKIDDHKISLAELTQRYGTNLG